MVGGDAVTLFPISDLRAIKSLGANNEKVQSTAPNVHWLMSCVYAVIVQAARRRIREIDAVNLFHLQ